MAREPERTADGRFLIIDGRRGRARDPDNPDALRAQLVEELMAARRAVSSDPQSARPRVQDAKLALGERGEPWWQPTEAGRRTRLAATMRTLLRHRTATATICPSDAARVVGGPRWRELMDSARAVAAELARDGILVITSKGQPLPPDQLRGPVRLGRGPGWR
ncbi:MAG TPA: DUF3253 domain-containing protein [Jatrophihabitans sp.]|nr:DUF3253 domain-containing protein [Jatrophihabitans sp.]